MIFFLFHFMKELKSGLSPELSECCFLDLFMGLKLLIFWMLGQVSVFLMRCLFSQGCYCHLVEEKDWSRSKQYNNS